MQYTITVLVQWQGLRPVPKHTKEEIEATTQGSWENFGEEVIIQVILQGE